jgi:hypothetical protein
MRNRGVAPGAYALTARAGTCPHSAHPSLPTPCLAASTPASAPSASATTPATTPAYTPSASATTPATSAPAASSAPTPAGGGTRAERSGTVSSRHALLLFPHP